MYQALPLISGEILGMRLRWGHIFSYITFLVLIKVGMSSYVCCISPESYTQRMV